MYKELVLGRVRSHLSGQSIPDPRCVYYIDPRKIVFATCLDNGSPDWEDWVLPQRGTLKPVQSGDWDASIHKFADMRIHAAVAARIHEGAAWKSTDYYRTAIRQIDSGRYVWGCRTAAEFDLHCRRIDELIESITRDGYRSGAELADAAHFHVSTGQTEVLVNLSREGLPLFQDGRHRLAIALALGLPRIPVQVFVRHAEWQGFREYMRRMAASTGGGASKKAGSLYQPALHFDLEDLPAEHGCEDRWAAIEPYLSPSGNRARALDIGCNLGFMCHRLEERGYAAVGVEYRPEVAYAARRIATAEMRSLSIVTGDILDEATLEPIGSSFDVVLALNIFHHFIKSASGYERLRALMRRLQVDLLFFEPHRPDDPQMRSAYANPAPLEFARMISEWSGLHSIEEIYKATDGRILFVLRR